MHNSAEMIQGELIEQPLPPLLRKKKTKRSKTLTTKQTQFIRYYIETKDKKKALELAGYKSQSNTNSLAAQLLANPLVSGEIAAHNLKVQNVSIVSFNDKVALLWSIANQCAKPMIETIGDRQVVVNKQPIAIKAIEVLNAMQGHNAPINNVNVNINSTIDRLKQCAIEYKDY